MNGHIFAAYLFRTLTSIVVVFQIVLAVGVPWGEMAICGNSPGRLPTKMQVAAVTGFGAIFFLFLIS